MHHRTDPALDHCIEQCWSCRDTCQSTLFNYCIDMGGPHVDAGHVRLMMDCIEMCQTSADFMTRNSQLYGLICAACGEACEACAKSCDAIGDAEMQKCAESCWRCARSCREMAERAGVTAHQPA